VAVSDTVPETPSGDQLSLFPGVTGPRAGEGPPGERPPEPIAEEPAPDSGQLELFADYAVLARDLEVAISDGRFEEAVQVGFAMADAFVPSEALRDLAWLDRLAAAAWEGPPAAPLSVWAEIDRQLSAQPCLQDRVRRGAFIRLRRAHTAVELMEARPECLPLLVRALGSEPGRSAEEARFEARGLVRDSLVAGRTLDPLDFREDEAVADLLAEDLPPRWLACLGRIRRLWPSSPPRESEWNALLEVARGHAGSEDPAMAFWHCLRLAESPGCPEDLRHAARRRMKQLHPDLHAAFMRRAATG
jgi:hypothetical protein